MNWQQKHKKMNWRTGFGIAAVCLAFQLQPAFAASGNLDVEIGTEGAIAVATQMGIYEDPVLTDYVTAVGERLVEALADERFTFRFFVVDDQSPNAFALPGGFVFITRGLLPLLQTEDELAGVMAHEIIHVTERHGVQRGRRGLFGSLLKVPGRIVGGLVDERVGALINSPITGANKLVLASYGRNQERESDTKGIRLMASAGYDPTQLSTFLTRLAGAVEVVTGESERRTMLRDHPVTADRVSYLDRTAGKLKRAATYSTGVDLFAIIAGVPVGPNPDRGIFVENQLLHPILNLALVFPVGWQTFNLPTVVGALSPEQDGALFYSLEDSPETPTALGKAFVDNLPEEYQPMINRSEPVTVNGIPAYVVTLVQNPRSGERIYVHIAWAAFDDFTLRLAAYGTDALQEILRTSARSFRRLVDADRAAIERIQIGIATAQSGETVGAFSERVGNHWSEDLTRTINDIEEDVLGNRRLKILEVLPYFDSPETAR